MRLKRLLHQIRHELEQTQELIAMIEDGLDKADTVKTKTDEKRQIKREVNVEQYRKLRTALIHK